MRFKVLDLIRVHLALTRRALASGSSPCYNSLRGGDFEVVQLGPLFTAC